MNICKCTRYKEEVIQHGITLCTFTHFGASLALGRCGEKCLLPDYKMFRSEVVVKILKYLMGKGY